MVGRQGHRERRERETDSDDPNLHAHLRSSWSPGPQRDGFSPHRGTRPTYVGRVPPSAEATRRRTRLERLLKPVFDAELHDTRIAGGRGDPAEGAGVEI